MSTALYRRYRPDTFADVIGQEHVTEPLIRALDSGRISHAYLFSGPRGCGKTTSARILARCLNCEQGPTGSPCGTCDSCVALARGGSGSIDVIEIDAASHGGVDDARELREKAAYAPADSRYKVYIIDEAHMVTTQGFNALLKIVEEPPEHVKFVFATTEPEKVIGTIRSRTHHYPFRLVPPARLHDYLAQLADAEGVAVEPGVLSFVVRAGGGSVRDSLSVLDQLIAGSDERGLTYEGAAALLGFTDSELLDAAINAFAAADGAGVFQAIDRVIETGLDPRRFVEDLLERFRDLIVLAAVPDGASSVLRGLPADQIERMRVQSAAFGAGALSRAADIVNTGLTEMTGATAPRLQLELIAARVLLPAAAGERGYAARLDRLERRLDVGGVHSAAAATGPGGGPRQASSEASQLPEGPSSRGQIASAPNAPGGASGDSRDPSGGRGSGDSRDPSGGRNSLDARGSAGGRNSVDNGALERPAPAVGRPASGVADSHALVATGNETPGRRADAADPGQAPIPVPAGPAGLDIAALRRAWPDVLGKIFTLKRSTWTFLSEHAQIQDYDGQKVVLGIATVGLANTFRAGVHADIVRQALIDVLGLDVRVEGIASADAPRAARGPAPTAPRSVPAQDRQTPPTRGRSREDSAGRPDSARQEPPRQSTPGPGTPDHGAGQGASEGAAPPDDGLIERARRDFGDAPSWGSAPTTSAPSWATESRDPAGVSAPAPTIARLDASEEDLISDDDESLAELGEVGQIVVERLLGGKVIGTDEG